MFKRLVSTAVVFGAAAIAPPAAHAQTNCAPRDVIVERLEDKYTEHLAGGGLQNENQLLEIWTSDKTGSFTVLMSRPDGISCIVASGHHWNQAVTVATPAGTPS